MAYETSRITRSSRDGGNGWNRTNTFSSSASRADYLHYIPKKLAGPEGLAPSRSVLETNPSARTSRTYGARAGSRCLEDSRASVNTSRAKVGGGRTVTLRLLRIASAACCYWHYSPKSGRACRICTGVGQFCGLPDGCSPNARRNRTAAQVTRREKTSLTSVLSDRGLKIGGAGGSCTRTGRIKSPLC